MVTLLLIALGGAGAMEPPSLRTAQEPPSVEALAADYRLRGLWPLSVRLQVLESALHADDRSEAVGTLARDVVGAALAEGAPDLAFELWDRLPRGLRAIVLRKPRDANERRHPDLALELALAAVELGRADSRSFVRAVAEPRWSTPVDEFADDNCATPVYAEALLRVRDAKRRARDTYPLAKALITCYRGAPFPRTFATLLERQEPALARKLRAAHPGGRDSFLEEYLSPSLARFAADAKRRIAEARQRAAARLPAAPTADRVAELVRSRPRSPWERRPLADSAAPALRLPGDQPEASSTGFRWSSRREAHGAELWTVSPSKVLDPTGELSPGAYWLNHSSDGGTTWDQALYLDLPVAYPYAVAASSEVPMIGDDGMVRLEARIIELADVVTFPSSERAAKDLGGAMIEAKLAALRADSDGDGLTDLAEARMATDPGSADTDADGLTDAADPLPGVPRARRQPSRRALVMTGVLRALMTKSGPDALEVDVPNEPLATLPPLGLEPVWFIVGDRADFVGTRCAQRVVVLAEPEWDQLGEGREPQLPTEIDLVMDAAGKHAYVVWSEQWVGGEFEATFEHGHWVIRETREWIT